jgi:hypothetical protein
LKYTYATIGIAPRKCLEPLTHEFKLMPTDKAHPKKIEAEKKYIADIELLLRKDSEKV